MKTRAISAVTTGVSTEQAGNSSAWSAANQRCLGFLWRYARPYSSRLLAAFLMSIPLAALGGVLPWAFKQVTELLSRNTPLKAILFWMAVGLSAVSLRSGLEILNKYILTILHIRLSNDIRNDLYERLQESSMEFHMRSRSGEVASLVSNDAQAAAAGVIELYSAAWQSPATVVCLLAVMIYFNATMSVLAILSIPVLSLCVTAAGKRAQKAERSFLDRQGKLLGWMVESLTNVRQVKSFNLERLGKKRFYEYGQELVHYRKRGVLLKSLVSPAAEITNGVALMAMAVLAYYQLSHGATTPGAIVGCLTAALGLKRPLKSISNSVVELQKSVAAVQRISWVYGNVTEVAELKSVTGTVETIQFEDVAFSYDGRHNVLRDVCIEVRSGERIAIIGPSGAGKTTLIDLLISFYPCSAGRILVNGLDISTIDLNSWRRQIGIVSQEPLLFDASIEENIRYGYQNASPERLREAAQLAGCDEIFQRLPNGIETRVGERGGRLSGGERKRVALARALARPISVLILDEATSELDSETEQDILESVDKIADGLIIFHISHRRSVLKHCDRAILLRDGTAREKSIVECMARLDNGNQSLVRQKTPA